MASCPRSWRDVAGFLLANWYFTPPLRVHGRRGREPRRAGGLPARRRRRELLVATASRRHGRGGAGARRGGDARGAQRQLVAVGGPAARSWSAQVRSRSTPSTVAVLQRSGGRLDRRGASRAKPCRRAAGGRRRRVPLHAEIVLVVSGRGLAADDLEMLQAFAGQVAIAVQQRELRADAARRRGPRGGERAAHRAARGGVARPADAAVVDQGVGQQPAAARRRLHARRRRASCSRPSTRAPIGSTTSSATCST